MKKFCLFLSIFLTVITIQSFSSASSSSSGKSSKKSKRTQDKRKLSNNQHRERISPEELGILRSSESSIPLTEQVNIPGGTYWFGSQLEVKGKVIFNKAKDGAEVRKKAKVK